MRPQILLPLAVLTAALTACSVDAQPGHARPAKVFTAVPGSNTLMATRDAIRAWRATGPANAAAVVRLARGEYALTEPLVLEAQDGDESWEARDPGQTLISGGRHLANFISDRAGIWQVKTGLRFEQLYVNGKRATRARSPAEGFFKMESVQEKNLPNGRVQITARVPAAALAGLPPESAALRDVQLLVFHQWDTSRYAVASFDAAAHTITVEGDRMKSWNPWNARSRFFLDNCRTTPWQPGTWFLDRDGGLSYCPRPHEQMDKTDVVVPFVEKFVEIRGAANLHFKGLRFHYAGYRLPPTGSPPLQASAGTGATIQIDAARDVTFENCEIAHTGTYGIWFRRGCRDGRVQHCLLEDLGAGGLRIGEPEIRDQPGEQTMRIIADNNIIRGGGRIHPSAVGVWIGQSADNRVTHNDLSDFFYTGISVGWTWGYGRSLATNNFIGFNRIHQIGQGVLSDMGGIYTLGVSPGSTCIGNVIFDVQAHDYGGWGLYPDEGSTGWQMASNLVWNCTCVNPGSGGGFHQHYGATNYIANNIFAFSSGPPLQATRVENHLSFILEHNLIISSNTAFFTGPWDKLHFASRSNCFAFFGSPRQLFPNGDLAAWQKSGHDIGSILAPLEFRGAWPAISLPRRSPAWAVGFKMFDPNKAGVYGGRAWQRCAQATEEPDRKRK